MPKINCVPDVELPHNGGAKATRLGFGGSNLLGNKTQDEGLALLETAFDEGVRHFDVAPYYGYGDAEPLLGNFLLGKRHQITIATKFGLQPMRQLAGAKKLIAAARKIMRRSPWARNIVRRNARSLSKGGLFDVQSARASLENSLRALKTDFIDIYLLHECCLQDCTSGLLEFLNEMKIQGKIGSFGIGTSIGNCKQIICAAKNFTSVIQCRDSIAEPHASHLHTTSTNPENRPFVITHGSLTPLAAINARILKDPAWATNWASKLDIDLHNQQELAGALLQLALRSNSLGIVLFQSSSRDRIRRNIRATTSKTFSEMQLATLRTVGSDLHSGRVDETR